MKKSTREEGRLVLASTLFCVAERQRTGSNSAPSMLDFATLPSVEQLAYERLADLAINEAILLVRRPGRTNYVTGLNRGAVVGAILPRTS